MTFTVGWSSVALAAVLPLVYLLGRKVRQGIAWMNGSEPPRERPAPYAVVFLVSGFIFGSFLQPYWDRGVQCRDAGRPVFSCVLFPRTMR